MSNIILNYNGARAEVQMRGAQLASYKLADGREVLWQGSAWPQHTPVLFPVCGSIKDEKIKIAGKIYPMTKHGFTRNPDFKPVKVGEDFVDMVLEPTDESKPMYPFEFRLHVIHTLLEKGFRTTLLVENLSDKIMPFCAGGHPGFAVPMEDGAKFEDYDVVFPQKEDGVNSLAAGGGCIGGTEILPEIRDKGTLSLKHELFDERDAIILTSLKSRSVKLINRKSGKGILFEFPKMEVLGIWSMPKAKADYLCLEPWHGMPDTLDCSGNFEDKPFVTLLKPGKSWQGSYTVNIID